MYRVLPGSPLAGENIYGIEKAAEMFPMFITRPSNRLPVVKQREKDQSQLAFDFMEWGLKARDWKDPKKIRPIINAKAETIHRLPSFRTPFKKFRCLTFADGFYEPDSETRQPWLIRFKDKRFFAFPGVYSTPLFDEEKDRGYSEGFSIITTEPNGLMEKKVHHHRMPVLFTDPKAMRLWLDPEAESDELRDLLKPHPDKGMEAYKVPKTIYKKKPEDESVLEPMQD